MWVVNCTPVVLGSKELDWKTAVSVYTTSSWVPFIFRKHQERQYMCCAFTTLNCSQEYQGSFLFSPASWENKMDILPMRQLDVFSLDPILWKLARLPKAFTQHGARAGCPQVGRLFPLHANLELPMNTSKPWILIHKLTQIHKFTIF